MNIPIQLHGGKDIQSLILIVGGEPEDRRFLIQTACAEENQSDCASTDTPVTSTEQYDVYETETSRFIDLKTPVETIGGFSDRLLPDGNCIDRIWYCIPCDMPSPSLNRKVIRQAGEVLTVILTQRHPDLKEKELEAIQTRIGGINPHARVVSVTRGNSPETDILSMELLDVFMETAERMFDKFDKEMNDILAMLS